MLGPRPSGRKSATGRGGSAKLHPERRQTLLTDTQTGFATQAYPAQCVCRQRRRGSHAVKPGRASRRARGRRGRRAATSTKGEAEEERERGVP